MGYLGKELLKEQLNYRGRSVLFPGGALIVLGTGVSIAILALIDLITDSSLLEADLGPITFYLFGVALLGLIDDLYGERSRGWRGHARALLAGQFSAGALKAVGSLALACVTIVWLGGYDLGNGLLAVLILILATNLFNILDLRPGRAVKTFVAVAVLLSLLSWTVSPLEITLCFAIPVLIVGYFDLRERVMLGDTGSNLIGGLAGFWILFTLTTVGGQLIALALLVTITAYGELRSISETIERIPLLRKLDCLGRADTRG